MPYIGIDPGKGGGIAYSDNGDMTAIKMPETHRDILDALKWCDPEESFAVIEWIHPAIPGASKSTMSKLYGNYQSLMMALTAAQIPFDIVKPGVWQRAHGIQPRKPSETTTQWKNRLKGRAQELFPKMKVTLHVSDAILIADYCRRLHH